MLSDKNEKALHIIAMHRACFIFSLTETGNITCPKGLGFALKPFA